MDDGGAAARARVAQSSGSAPRFDTGAVVMSNTVTFRLDPNAQRKWRAAMQELASITKKEDPESLHKLVTLSARRFVKNVADITPPSSGKADSKAKQAGEKAILADLLRIALPAVASGPARIAREVFTSAEELIAAHARAVSKNTGRVNPRNRRDKLLVSQATFNSVLRTLQKRVGWLAAALNVAAAKLGFRLPSWIARHGERFGKIEVLPSGAGLKVRIIQNVPYADNVRGYATKWNFALRKEANGLVAQVKAIMARKGAKARSHLT